MFVGRRNIMESEASSDEEVMSFVRKAACELLFKEREREREREREIIIFRDQI